MRTSKNGRADQMGEVRKILQETKKRLPLNLSAKKKKNQERTVRLKEWGGWQSLPVIYKKRTMTETTKKKGRGQVFGLGHLESSRKREEKSHIERRCWESKMEK